MIIIIILFAFYSVSAIAQDNSPGENESIKYTRELLKKLGNYSSGIDGQRGNMTNSAILKFKEGNGLPVNKDIDMDFRITFMFRYHFKWFYFIKSISF